MKNLSFSIAAFGVFALFASSSAMAHPQEEYDHKYTCQQGKKNAAVAGGFIGAGLGGAAGKAIAAAGVRPEGIVLGAVVGGILGANFGKETVYCGDDHDYTQKGGRSYGDNNGQYNGHANQWGYDAGWYVPSANSYYGQERAVYAAQPVYAQPAYVQPMQYSGQQTFVSEYSSGIQYVPAPQYAPAPQYVPAAPQSQAPCGYWVCQ